MANSKYDFNNIEKNLNVIISIQFLFLLIYEYIISVSCSLNILLI